MQNSQSKSGSWTSQQECCGNGEKPSGQTNPTRRKCKAAMMKRQNSRHRNVRSSRPVATPPHHRSQPVGETRNARKPRGASDISHLFAISYTRCRRPRAHARKKFRLFIDCSFQRPVQARPPSPEDVVMLIIVSACGLTRDIAFTAGTRGITAPTDGMTAPTA